MGTWMQTQYQEALESLLHSIFPHHNILSNTRKQVAIVDSRTGGYLEVDVWAPELNLCFEFQDFYHYKSSWYNQMPLHVVQQKDDTKRYELMKDRQTLVPIPCWWDGDVLSLQSTICFHRPELEVLRHTTEISANPPVSFFEEHLQQNDLMLASFPNTNLMDQSAWWVGEKWDGIRCYWDAAQQQLYSRNSMLIDIHSRVKDLFGNLELDTEFWSGRGCFYEIQALSLTVLQSLDISFTRLMCFDIASMQLQHLPFETRYSLILSYIHEQHPLVINSPRFLCASEATLQETIHDITTEGGEGVVLRRPLSSYLPGRSDSLFKLKVSMGDQDACVVKVETDGSLILQPSHGVPFLVPKRNVLLPRRVVLGDVVTFRIDNSGDFMHPKPVVYRIRSDLSWDHFKYSGAMPYLFAEGHDSRTNIVPDAAVFQNQVNKKSTWLEMVRVLFESFATSKGMDSLNPHFWYQVTRSDLIGFNKGYKGITTHYGGKLTTILMLVYPDIGLQRKRFKERNKRWKFKMKYFFDTFAESKGMDSLNPLFWYDVMPSEIIRFDQGYKRIASNFGGKLTATLIHVYPAIGLQHNQFKITLRKLEKIRRTLFDKFAASKGMDPLNPVFWYNVTPSELAHFNKMYLSIARSKLSTSLIDVYPNIGLQAPQFKVNKQSWTTEKTQQIFDQFAASRSMDPLNPVFWYNTTPVELAQFNKRFYVILSYHGGKLYAILSQLYPDIGLNQLQFKARTRQLWSERAKTLLDDFAASKGMDSLNPVFWYNTTIPDIVHFNKAYKNISSNHGKLSTILDRVYPALGIQHEQFKAQYNPWRFKAARQALFDNFAAAKGMDPLNPVFWYRVKSQDLLSFEKGYATIRRHYGGKLSTVLARVYPNIALQPSKFKR